VPAKHAEKADLFVWEFYDGVADRRRYLERAREAFLTDHPDGRGRYVAAALPDLPFADDSFSLVLSPHSSSSTTTASTTRFTSRPSANSHGSPAARCVCSRSSASTPSATTGWTT